MHRSTEVSHDRSKKVIEKVTCLEIIITFCSAILQQRPSVALLWRGDNRRTAVCTVWVSPRSSSLYCSCARKFACCMWDASLLGPSWRDIRTSRYGVVLLAIAVG